MHQHRLFQGDVGGGLECLGELGVHQAENVGGEGAAAVHAAQIVAQKVGGCVAAREGDERIVCQRFGQHIQKSAGDDVQALHCRSGYAGGEMRDARPGPGHVHCDFLQTRHHGQGALGERVHHRDIGGGTGTFGWSAQKVPHGAAQRGGGVFNGGVDGGARARFRGPQRQQRRLNDIPPQTLDIARRHERHERVHTCRAVRFNARVGVVARFRSSPVRGVHEETTRHEETPEPRVRPRWDDPAESSGKNRERWESEAAPAEGRSRQHRTPKRGSGGRQRFRLATSGTQSPRGGGITEAKRLKLQAERTSAL
eukprot:ctg_351.g175